MSISTLSAWRPAPGGTLLSDFMEPWGDWPMHGGRTVTMPPINISEGKTCYKMELAAPGYKKDDFKLTLTGNVLTIAAEKEEDKEVTERTYSRKEHSYSSFSRSFTISDNVQQDKIEASYEGGILKIALPKNDHVTEAANKTIAVK